MEWTTGSSYETRLPRAHHEGELFLPPLRTSDRHSVELGCGKKKAEIDGDLVGVDCARFETVDIVTNLDHIGFDPEYIAGGHFRSLAYQEWKQAKQRYQGGWRPWAWAEDGSCALIIAHQVLEHLQNLIPAMNEIWRICDADSYIETIVPYGTSKGALQDPTHVRFFTEVTWRYWEPGFVESFSAYGIEGHFAICGQDWSPRGNLWTLLRPLKADRDLVKWKEMREASEKPVKFPAPKWLLDRGKDLLG